MRRAVRHIRPALMVLLEAELWPAHLAALKNAGTYILVANGRMRAKSLKRYRLWPALWRHLGPDDILAMSDADARRFAALFGSRRIHVVPNLKFDRLDLDSPDHNAVNPLAPLFLPDVELLAMGSIREAEEEAVQNIITAIRRLRPNTVIGLFPPTCRTADGMGAPPRSRPDTLASEIKGCRTRRSGRSHSVGHFRGTGVGLPTLSRRFCQISIWLL